MVRCEKTLAKLFDVLLLYTLPFRHNLQTWKVSFALGSIFLCMSYMQIPFNKWTAGLASVSDSLCMMYGSWNGDFLNQSFHHSIYATSYVLDVLMGFACKLTNRLLYSLNLCCIRASCQIAFIILLVVSVQG